MSRQERVLLFSGSSRSATLAESAANFDHVLVKIARDGFSQWVTTKSGETASTVLFVNAATSYAVMLNLYTSGTSMSVTSEIGMPISAYKFGTGSAQSSTYIREVVGVLLG